MTSDDSRYEAVNSRDARCDGEFFAMCRLNGEAVAESIALARAQRAHTARVLLRTAVGAGMRHPGAEAVDAEAWRPRRTYAMHHVRDAAAGRRRTAPAERISRTTLEGPIR